MISQLRIWQNNLRKVLSTCLAKDLVHLSCERSCSFVLRKVCSFVLRKVCSCLAKGLVHCLVHCLAKGLVHCLVHCLAKGLIYMSHSSLFLNLNNE